MSKDLIKRLRDSTYLQFPSMAVESAYRIEQLEAENAALRAELDDVKQVQFPRKLEAVVDGWRKKLAASQACEQQLKGVFKNLSELDYSGSLWMLNLRAILRELIDLPSDTTALEAIIAKAGEVMRERIVANLLRCGALADGDYLNAIRALPAVALDNVGDAL